MVPLTIPQAFDLAVRHHQAGRLGAAEQLYRQILAQQPEHADAVHLLGIIAGQGGQYELAVDLIRQAIGFGVNAILNTFIIFMPHGERRPAAVAKALRG